VGLHSKMRLLVLATCVACATALRIITPAPAHTAIRSCSRLVPTLQTPLPTAWRRSATVRMLDLDGASKTFYDEYVETDAVTGERKSLSFGEKEKLYLECLDAYYNEDGKQILGDEEYETLKLDLDFEGSRIATFSSDEIKFVLSNKRYSMGKPIMSDAEYDTLRNRLKAVGSPVIIHDAAKCSLEDGLCKNDLQVDAGKTRLLYLPGTVGGLILFCEASFWTLGIDPLLSIVLGSVPSYFFGVWFTENIFAQKPLVTTSACPNCGALNTVFFGDLFSVMTDGIVGKAAPPSDVVELKCGSCKEVIAADRAQMLVTTTVPKI